MKMFTHRGLIALALLTTATATGFSQARPSSGGIVVFGTSLSDSGNAFSLLGATSTPPDYLVDPLLVPSAPYARGGQHFSNGATWVEQFARSRGLAGSVRPAFASSDINATNYAVGAARAREDGINVNLATQVDRFLQQSSGVANPDSLYVIEMGGNDIRDALRASATGGNPGLVLTQANIAIAGSVQILYAAGARRFLIWRAPDVGMTPALRTLDQFSPGAAQGATALTQAFNDGLDGVVVQLSGLPGIDIVRLDAFALLHALVANPEAFGLTNVTTACITPSIAPFTCTSPDEFLFWDGIHPTKAVHAIVAQEAAAALAR